MVIGTNLSSYARIGGLLTAAFVLFLPVEAVAQLSPTQWLEDISMAADSQSDGQSGASKLTSSSSRSIPV